MTKSDHPHPTPRATTTETQGRSIAEHDLVRTREALSGGAVTVPEGTVGTIVFVHEKDSAFEVEFAPPFEAVLSVARCQIEAV